MHRPVTVFLSRKGGARPLARSATAFSAADAGREGVIVCIEEDFEYQTIRGFGGAATEAAAETWRALPAAERRRAARLCFDPVRGLGYTCVRVPAGSCDFFPATWSCDDTPGDAALRDFSVARYRGAVLPMLEAAREAAGRPLWILATPWSPPAWMKTNGAMAGGGALRPGCRAAWARHLAAFARAFASEGFPLGALAVQNEENGRQPWESCVWTAEQTRDFVRDHLGTALRRLPAAIRPALYFWDHNKDRVLERARVLLGDRRAAAAVEGVAVHWYSGDHFGQLRMFRERWPEKEVVATEACCSPWKRTEDERWREGERYAHDIAGDLGAGATRWLDWNLLLDARGGPNHVEGFWPGAAPLMADETGRRVVVRPSWAHIAHYSRYLRPGAVRLGTSAWSADIDVVAARNTDGSFAVVLLNRTGRAFRPALRFRGLLAPLRLPPRSVATCVWKP